MTELCKLGYKYGTDKAGYYTHFYHTLFAPMCNGVDSVLEIGIGTVPAMTHVQNYKPGASLRMWRDYFPSADIIGVDIEPSVMFEEHRIHTAIVNQGSKESLLTIKGEFDIIIDDGSHNPDHQILSFNTLFSKVIDGGFYIIEDVNVVEQVSPRIKHDHSVVQVQSNNRQGQCIVIQKF